jgi:WD40 repeat protein
MRVINVTKVAHFSGHNGPIYSLCTAINPKQFYSGGNDGYVVLWDTETKGDGKLLVQVNRPVYALCLDTQRNLLFCGAASGNLHVVDLTAGKEIRNIEAHCLGIFDIKLNKKTNKNLTAQKAENSLNLMFILGNLNTFITRACLLGYFIYDTIYAGSKQAELIGIIAVILFYVFNFLILYFANNLIKNIFHFYIKRMFFLK